MTIRDIKQFIDASNTAKIEPEKLAHEISHLVNNGTITSEQIESTIDEFDYLSEAQRQQLLQLLNNILDDNNEKTVLLSSEVRDDEGDNNDDKTYIKPSTIDDEDDKTRINAPLTDKDDKTRLVTTEATAPDDDKTRLVSDNDLDRTVVSHETDLEKTAVTPQTNNTAPSINTSQSSQPLQTGSIINNRFELMELLGRGGMGSVFKARDKRKEEANDSNPYVAIKFLNEDFKQHPQSLISLQRECKKSQELAHPNIITVHDFDRDGDTVYMTMELMDGEPLDELLARYKNIGLEHELALNILKDVSLALAYAHEKGLVHSDFKPGNVFVTKDGRAKVLDFGIARAVKHSGETSTGDSTVFDAGELGGLTPAYASCEMLEGEVPAPADDIYAVGCVAYQLFTGTHPFNKLPANQARDKKLTPSPLKQLERKQAQALLNTLKFDRTQRTETAQVFVDEFFEKKQASKGLKFSLAIAALLLIGVGVKLFLDFQSQQAVIQLISTVNQGDATTVANSISQINQLNQSAKETVLLEVRDRVIDFYSNQALPLVNQNMGKYDYPQALDVLSSAKSLYPDSAKIQDLIDQLQSRKNQLLNTLANQINEYVNKGSLHTKTTTDDINEVFELIRVIDPQSKLLNDQRLQLAYSREIKKTLNDNKLKTALLLIENGLSLFPASKELTHLQTLYENQKVQASEDKKLAELQEKLKKAGTKISDVTRQKAIKRHKEKLGLLIDSPFDHDNWINNLHSEIVSLKTFLNRKDSEADKLISQASKLIVDRAKSERRDGNLVTARRLLNTAKKLAPNNATLQRESRALAVAERKSSNEQASLERSEKIKALKQTLLTQAKANDVKAAKTSLEKLQQLDPKNTFIQEQGPKAIGDAYMRLADGLSKRDNFSQALALIEAGLTVTPHYNLLNTAKERYAAEIALIELTESFAALDLNDEKTIEKKLAQLKRGFPQNIDQIRKTLSSQLLNSIKAAAENDQAAAKIFAETAQALFPENSEIMALTKRSSKFQAAGGQACKNSYAGHGKRTRATCYDILKNGRKAPLLIVVPGVTASDKPFAISKYEISVSDFNEYCNNDKACTSKSNNGEKTPAVNMNIDTVNNYLQWLSNETKNRYRLPTVTEWQHAANAAGKQPIKDFNCRLMLGNKQIKGLHLVNVQSGKQNDWGLKNYIGNAQEFAMENGKIYANGGAYTDSFSKCDINLQRRHNGSADDITGFRVVKEL